MKQKFVWGLHVKLHVGFSKGKRQIHEKKILFTSKLDTGKTLEKCYIWNIAFYGAKIFDTSENI
jgi:hypothetical protein